MTSPDQPTTTATIHDRIAANLPHGGFLRCNVCRRREDIDDSVMVALYLRVGWPKCHGYTMTWWTQRQILTGEAPSA